jgi:hypothetical protein
MLHLLKTESKYFRKIAEVDKTYEVRKNDRDFRKGDYLGLNEITDHICNSEGERKETGNFILVKVLDVLSDERFVKPGYVIMSIRPCKISEIEWDYAPWYTECNAATPVLPMEIKI